MALEPEERAALANGEALYQIRDTAGFKALEVYLANLATKGAFKALNDEDDPESGVKKRGAKFWRGYVECARQIVADVDAAIQDAQRIKEQAEESGTSFAGMRIGGGTIAGE